MTKISPYCGYIVDLLSVYGNITARKMFGGYGIYQNGIIVGIIAEDELYFKVDESNQSDYEEFFSEAFVYNKQGKMVSMSYWKVPLEVLEDENMLSSWLRKSYLISSKGKN